MNDEQPKCELCARLRAEIERLRTCLENLRQYQAVEGYEEDTKLVGLAYRGSGWGPCVGVNTQAYELAENVEQWLHRKIDEALAAPKEPAPHA